MKKIYVFASVIVLTSLCFALSQTSLPDLRALFLDQQCSMENHLRAFNEIKNLDYPEKFYDLNKAMSLYPKSEMTDTIKSFILEAFSNPKNAYLSQSETVNLIEYAYHLYYFGPEEILYLKQVFLFQLNPSSSFSDSDKRIFVNLLGYMAVDFKLQQFLDVIQRLEVIATAENDCEDFMMRYSAIEALGNIIKAYRGEKIWVEEMNQWLRNTYRYKQTNPVVRMKTITVLELTQSEQNRVFFETEVHKTQSPLVREEIQRALLQYN